MIWAFATVVCKAKPTLAHRITAQFQNVLLSGFTDGFGSGFTTWVAGPLQWPGLLDYNLSFVIR